MRPVEVLVAPGAGTVAAAIGLATLAGIAVEAFARPVRRPPAHETGSDDDTVPPGPLRPGDEPDRWSTWRRVRPRRRRASITPSLGAGWLDEIARATRSGRSLAGAVAHTRWPASHDRSPRRAAPDPTDTLRLMIRRGTSIGDAVSRWTQTHPGHATTAIGTALVVADEVGGSIAVPLERAAAALRAQAADDDERLSWAAQARLSARLLALLPLAVLFLLAVTDPDVVGVLRSPLGLTILVLGTSLDATGFWWMRRIVGRVAT